MLFLIFWNLSAVITMFKKNIYIKIFFIYIYSGEKRSPADFVRLHTDKDIISL